MQKKGIVDPNMIPFTTDFKRGAELLTHPELFKFQNKKERKEARELEKKVKAKYKASGSKKSYTQWLKDNGLIEDRFSYFKSCSVM